MRGLAYLKACAKDPSGSPPVPANSVCRQFNNSLAPEDHRIGVVPDDPQYPFEFTFDFGPYAPSYLYAYDGSMKEYGLGDLHANVLQAGSSGFAFMRVCIVDPGPAMSPFASRYALVAQMYRDFYGRAATTADQYVWAGSGKSQAQILTSFVDGDAAKRGPLVRLYKAFYKRWPDAGGYDY